MKKIIAQLIKYVKNQKYIVTFILILFLIGVFIGSLFISFISTNDKEILYNQVDTYFKNISVLNCSVYGISYFKSDLINNIVQIVSIYLLGLSMVGIVFIILIIFFKGFILGTTLSSIVLKYNIKSIIGIVLYIIPIYALKIVLYVFVSFFAISASLKFIKAILKKEQLNFKTFLGKYIISFMISIILIIVLCLLDSYLTPHLLKLFTYL